MQFQDEESENYQFDGREYQRFKSPLQGRHGKVAISAIGYRTGASEITLLIEDSDGGRMTASFTNKDPNLVLFNDGDRQVRNCTTRAAYHHSFG
jgi:hypothetical protein